ncbi:hypothetical protein ACFFVB_18525 [Formosa undariae]|uniref:Uncharacterized protein n=1 Tax=Formosa undariae TaxID=1325436 RepID=A0ABV5F6L4_9FLAO
MPINNECQITDWLTNLSDFFPPEDIEMITSELLNVFLHSDVANSKKKRQKVYYFLEQIKKLKDIKPT